jgi:hypothetical protein
LIAPAAAGIGSWVTASESNKTQYMFVSLASQGGTNPDGTPGNTIF